MLRIQGTRRVNRRQMTMIFPKLRKADKVEAQSGLEREENVPLKDCDRLEIFSSQLTTTAKKR